MAYNPYTAVNEIYNLKGQWVSADKANDEEKKKSVAEKAQEYYQALRDNNYGKVADDLTAANYTQAKTIRDNFGKTGKTPTRDYLYSLGKSRGMSQSDVDALIGWDEQTNELSFGGKKIGTPDAIENGVSYWSDTSVLDDAFNDYIDRSGTVRSKSTAVDQENESLFAKYRQEYDDLKETNPFTTAEAKAILGKYSLAGLQGRDNAVASGGASNGGNIDSYASANAMRQQASLLNQGQMTVLDAHQQKIDNIRGLLSDMGVNIDRVFNQDETAKNNELARTETAKNNETARLAEEASVTGYTPTEWVIKNDDLYSTYLNEDGTFKKEMEHVDIQALINEAKEKGDTETAEKLAVVRAKKMLGNWDAFGQFANEGDTGYMKPQITEGRRASEQDAETTKYLSDNELTGILETVKANLEATKYVSDNELKGILATVEANLKGVKYTSDNELKAALETALINSEATKYVSDNELKGIVETAAANLELGKYQADTTLAATIYATDGGDNGGDNGGTKPTLTASQATTAIKNGEISQGVIDAYNYYYGTSYTVDNPPKLNKDDDTENGFDGGGGDDDSWTTFVGYFSTDTTIQDFLNNELKPYVDSGADITDAFLENLICGDDPTNKNSNTYKYDIDVEDAKKIIEMINLVAQPETPLKTDWLNNYKNRWGLNNDKGMKK